MRVAAHTEVQGLSLRPAVAEDALCLSVLAMQVFLDTYATQDIRLSIAREVLSGYSEHVFAHAEQLAAQSGATVLWLTPWIHNHRALRFYARPGYADHDFTHSVFEGESHENRVLAKAIVAAARAAWPAQAAATAGHQARSGATPCIFTSPGLMSCRLRPHERDSAKALAHATSKAKYSMSFSDSERAGNLATLKGFIDRRRPPEHVRSQLDIGYSIVGQTVDIFEIRPDWQDKTETCHTPVARVRYLRSKNEWRLYWMRRDLKWHSYEPSPVHRSLKAALTVIDADAYCCFFG